MPQSLRVKWCWSRPNTTLLPISGSSSVTTHPALFWVPASLPNHWPAPRARDPRIPPSPFAHGTRTQTRPTQHCTAPTRAHARSLSLPSASICDFCWLKFLTLIIAHALAVGVFFFCPPPPPTVRVRPIFACPRTPPVPQSSNATVVAIGRTGSATPEPRHLPQIRH